uniref:Uncharacterized protein n=1 Tax=Anopheles atroparvus TaxID=41427 RepID=A0AAG5CXT3_ANOAO
MTSPKISADKSSDSNANTPKHQPQSGPSGNEAPAVETSNAEGGPGVQAVVAATVQSIRERGFYGCFSLLKVFRFANLMIKQGC